MLIPEDSHNILFKKKSGVVFNTVTPLHIIFFRVLFVLGATINESITCLIFLCGSCTGNSTLMPQSGEQVRIEDVTDWSVVVQQFLALRAQKDSVPPE